MSATPETALTNAQQGEVLISRLLRTGVVLSLLLLVGGLVLTFIRHPGYLSDPAEYRKLLRNGDFPHTLSAVWSELCSLRGRAVMTLGLLVLIATPVLRVIASVVLFALQRDWRYVGITSTVLAVLLTAFLLGKAG